MERRSVFAGNWKMYKTSDETKAYFNTLLSSLRVKPEVEVVIFPPALSVSTAVGMVDGSGVSIGVQNIYLEKEGAFTGENSIVMVAGSGAKYLLVGHSERRNIFGESDEDVNKKVMLALESKIFPMICVGELLAEREAGKMEDILKRQVEKSLQGVTTEQMSHIVIAYEPVWAIGTGKVATPDMADEAHRFIREVVARLYDEAVADSLPILYGGSVKPENIDGIYEKENVDGVLVGGASLDAESMLKIIEAGNR